MGIKISRGAVYEPLGECTSQCRDGPHIKLGAGTSDSSQTPNQGAHLGEMRVREDVFSLQPVLMTAVDRMLMIMIMIKPDVRSSFAWRASMACFQDGSF